MSTKNETAVFFLHPRDASRFEAAITAATTGEQAIEGLIRANFIDAPSGASSYVLQSQRTGNSLPLSASLVAEGVQAGDIVAVVTTSMAA